jgi:DNA primase
MPRVNMHEQDYLFDTKKTAYQNSDLKLIKELISDVDIISILESEYDLFFQKQSNGWHNTNCPLPEHDDSSPSFGVNSDSGTFHCFGCGASGDLISFVRKMEGLGFKQALERVMFITGINPDVEANEIYRALREINSTADDFLNYQIEYNLPGGISPVQYLVSLADRIKKFEEKVSYSEKELEWVDSIYQKADYYIMKEDYKSLNKLWKNLSLLTKERLLNLESIKND